MHAPVLCVVCFVFCEGVVLHVHVVIHNVACCATAGWAGGGGECVHTMNACNVPQGAQLCHMQQGSD